MSIHDVYEDTELHHLFSDGVDRNFGENKAVITDTGAFIACVQPLMCDPEECGLRRVGTLEA
jgi:hypothetical protein